MLPVGFPLLLGYAVMAVRSAAADPSAGPPRWRLTRGLLADGLWAGLALAVSAVPFAAAAWAGAGLLARAWSPEANPLAAAALPVLLAGAAALLLWGLLAILLGPPALARFASSGRPLDLFDVPGSVALVRRRFATWNLTTAIAVTAWALAVVAAATCLGAPLAAVYGILVTAHACARLVEDPPAR